MEQRFELRGEWIALDQLMKAVAWVGSGGEAHALVGAGEVKVDGAVELRKRAKLRAGQRVSFHNDVVEIVASAA
jgi:ribosome-associated protein